MITLPAETPYCRLYIDMGSSREAVRTALKAKISEHFGPREVFARLAKNRAYARSHPGAVPYDPVTASRWTAEVDAEDASVEAFETFQSGLCIVIRELRAEGLIITASCDFEDRIAAETGWNWTETHPEPPG